MNIIKPKKLKKGDTIGIIAPCGAFKKPERLENALKVFEDLGFKVKVSEKLFEEKRYMAGEDEVRVREIENFFADGEVDGIVCVRGGYGAIRLIDKINYEVIKANPKPFCGFSDVTALSAMFLKRAGLVTYSAPMINGDFGNDISDFTLENFKKALMSEETLTFEGKILRAGEAKGISFGGNLATLVSLCGTDFLPDEDFIFFTEDLNEPAYKIDRMLTQLTNIEKFRQNIKGVVWGEFSDVDNQEFLAEILSEFVERLKIPAIKGLKITHSHDKITVPIGARAEIKEEKFILY